MKSREEKELVDIGGDEEGDEGVAMVPFEDRLTRIRQSKNQEKVAESFWFHMLAYRDV